MKKSRGWILGMVLLSVVLVGAFLTLSADQVPVHYNIQGTVDRWGSKYEFLIFPVISGVFALVMVLVAHREEKAGREENCRVVDGMTVMVLGMFNAMYAFFLWKALDPGQAGPELGPLWQKGLLLILAAGFIRLGNRMPKARRNAVFGLRTKWSMADDAVWQKSQRFGGWLMVVSGITGVVLVALLPGKWAWIAWIAVLVGSMTAGTAGTWILYRREHSRDS